MAQRVRRCRQAARASICASSVIDLTILNPSTGAGLSHPARNILGTRGIEIIVPAVMLFAQQAVPAADAGFEWVAPVAAVLAVVVAALTALRVSRDSARDRRAVRRHDLARQYGEALATAFAWAETAYRVARRTSDDPATLQLHALHIHDLQERLIHQEQWLSVESPEIAAAYTKLVQAIKEKTRPNVQDAWQRTPVTQGSEMNLGGIYKCDVTVECAEFLTAVGSMLDRISPRETA